jgi:hypothetical protein
VFASAANNSGTAFRLLISRYEIAMSITILTGPGKSQEIRVFQKVRNIQPGVSMYHGNSYFSRKLYLLCEEIHVKSKRY